MYLFILLYSVNHIISISVVPECIYNEKIDISINNEPTKV